MYDLRHGRGLALMGLRGRAALLVALGLLVALAGCSRPASPAAAPSAVVERGARLYAAYCQSCHGDAVGGTVESYPPVHNARGHTWHHPDCVLVQVTLDGAPPRPDMPADAPRMTAFRDTLTEDDARAVLAYIKTWWTDRQRAWQADVTRQAC
ncbi:MAG: cytochrome c [Chloroflexi bacterium]|nr:cytochrome c [Chloroflexota bacterium]